MMRQYWISVILLLVTTGATATENWLIATENELINTSGILSVEVIKPDTVKQWPQTLALSLSGPDKQAQINLSLTETTDHALRRSYTGIIPSDLKGHLRIALAEQDSNRLLIVTDDVISGAATVVASREDNVVKTTAVETNVAANDKKPFKRVYIEAPEEDRTITANEPLYFIVGSSDQRDFDARFQISFKYRPFDPGARVSQFIPYASNLYFAYTQTSIWDLGGESSPFKDTSYRPSIYYNWAESGKGWNPESWKFGLEHESNGRDGENSRSMNIAFVQPFWRINYSGGKYFSFMPKFYAYLEKTDNRDMHEYRGYVDWIARYGRDDAAILTAMYRQGTRGYGQGQVDLSYPISDKIFGRTGTFLHFQLLGGYGETLIDYDKRSDTQLRMGLSIAR